MSAPHESAIGHVTGSAEYIDDRPFVQGELYVEVFFSSKAKAKIVSIDVKKAASVPGVVSVFLADDIKNNTWGTIFKDQVYLAEGQVEYVGEPIAIVAAETREAAHSAKSKIGIEYQDLSSVLSLDEAIESKSFLGPLREIKRGEPQEKLSEAPHRLQGSLEIGGQDHFYLESQACIAYPREGNCLEIHSSSQHPTEVQHLVAEALGLQHSQVSCIVKRMGGAFGGKESQAAPFAVYAGLVAHKLGRAARLVLSKDDDMVITGKRNPFKNFYEVAFDDDGKIISLVAKLYADGGAYADLSTAIMERAMLHLDNAYYIPHFFVSGQVCKTNTQPNTAFRGFGGPQGVVTIEAIIEDIGQHLGKDTLNIRKLNAYKKGEATPYGQEIEDDILPGLFAQLEKETDYKSWRERIKAYNGESHSTIRGLSVTAVKFGIAFTTRFLNQGSALIHLQLDGTIQVSTGATEMGQGVNTKISHLVSDYFSIANENIRIMSTSTERNANTSATAASSGFDINGQAALNACADLKNKLARVALAVFSRPEDVRGKAVAGSGVAPEIDIEEVPASKVGEVRFEQGNVYLQSDPEKKIGFKDLLMEAYLNRVSLSAQGFYKYPEIFYNKETGQGRPFHYYTNGVAASEVSIDKFTGELKVLRTEILMDLGRPVNTGIDMGQVTGAFVQGMGWLSTEKLYYEKGRLMTFSPSTYKIPSIQDIPKEFNCRFFDNPTNKRNVKASKAVGEPPFLLATSVWTAVKNAIQVTSDQVVPLNVPATQERVFMAMQESEL